MPIFTELARAKINLFLHVRGKRADGYHNLESLVVLAEFGDTLILDTDRPLSFTTTGPFAAAIEGPNLVEEAVAAVRAAAPGIALGAFTLDKHLPVAAGIGGGSADAAAALRLLDRANARAPATPDYRAGMRLFDLPKIAASLGADVPVCFTNRPAFVTGTGVHVRVSNDPLPHVPLVLVNPGVPLSTPAVFKALNAGPAKPRTPGEPKLPRGPFADVADLARQLGQTRNDLEPPAVRLVPRIAEVLAALRGEPGCLLARLSGSGPTCFALCQSDRAAETIANHLAATHPYWWVKATRLRC